MPTTTHQLDIPEVDLWTTLFDRPSRTFPETQVIYEDAYTGRSYTYAALRSSTINFAHALVSRFNFQRGDVLALFTPNCIDTPVVTWGTHYIAGVVSPANPAYTVRELAHHLKDSGSKYLFTQKALLGVALKAATEAGIRKDKIVLIGDERQAGYLQFSDLLKESAGKEAKRAKIDIKKDLAYLVYSSGTTGLPKGVMLTHWNAVSNLHQIVCIEQKILFWNRDRVLSVLPYYHIYGLQCLVHLPAFLGYPSYVMSAFDLKKFCSIVQEQKVTATYLAPPIILHLAKNPIIANYDLSSLKFITSGAAPLAKDLIYAVYKRLGVGVKQAYGLSETSPATHVQIQWDDGVGSCGKPVPSLTIKFVDPDGKEVEKGKEGELWVSGPNVFVGYLNNEAATKSSISADGFFMTGDIGREDANGNMYITDRVKELIKFKGFQVAPAELEGLLMGNEMVDDVAVVGIQDDRQATEVPLAFIVGRKGMARSKENADILVKWLGERVAAHKRLRGGVRWVDAIPKSPSGKILRRVLKDMLKKEEDDKKAKAKL